VLSFPMFHREVEYKIGRSSAAGRWDWAVHVYSLSGTASSLTTASIQAKRAIDNLLDCQVTNRASVATLSRWVPNPTSKSCITTERASSQTNHRNSPISKKLGELRLLPDTPLKT